MNYTTTPTNGDKAHSTPTHRRDPDRSHTSNVVNEHPSDGSIDDADVMENIVRPLKGTGE